MDTLSMSTENYKKCIKIFYIGQQLLINRLGVSHRTRG